MGTNRKLMKKMVALLLGAVVLASSLAGCGAAPQTQPEVPSVAAETESATPAAETAATETAAETNAEPVEIELFVNHPWWTLREWKGSVPEEITRKTGVKFKITVTADDKQLPLLIASGDLPELVFADKSNGNFSRLSNSTISYSWNELIEEYAPDFQIDPKRSGLYVQPDGKFYTLLNNFSTQSEWESNAYALQNTPGLTIRKDLYEELGSPAINNFNDLENLLLAAKEAYPNMVPIHLNANWKFSYFESMFGVGGSQGWDGFYDDGNGGVSYWLRNPKYLDLLRLINNYYKKGLIDTKNFAFNSQEDDAQNPMLADKCFAMTFNAQIGDRTNGDFEKLGRDTRVFMVENLLSEDAKFFSNGVGWSGVFITKKNQHLKESINFMKYMFSEEGQRLGLWGIENEDWTLDPEGYPKFNYPTQDNTVMLEKGVFWWGLLSGSAVNEGLKNYDPTLMGTKVMQNAKPRFSYNPAIGLLNPAADTPEAVIKTKVSEMIKNEITKIVMAKSDEELQAAYADVISKAETIGLKQYEEWANATYKSALKSME